MARVAISEYAAKKLLLDAMYEGYSVVNTDDVNNLSLAADGSYVVKVDDGTKKRNKLDLVKVNLSAADAKSAAQAFIDAGRSRVLIEPFFAHDALSEEYISVTLGRDGVRCLYSKEGGGDVEEAAAGVESFLVPLCEVLKNELSTNGSAPKEILSRLLNAMHTYNMSFIEINPFVNTDSGYVYLDAAVEIDTAKLHTLPEWVADHQQGRLVRTDSEQKVRELEEQSTAAFSLTVFDENAQIFTLLSGGGASLTMLDTLVDNGLQRMVANYGEYSGAPTREETRVYTGELLKLLFASNATQKVLVIAGGVANFTDVMTTFAGIVDACTDYLDDFKSQSVMVRVRRGGPRQKEGLLHLESFFNKHGITAVVSDPSVALSEVAVDVSNYVHNKI